MGVHIVTRSLALLLIATTTSQFMPPSSFPYAFQHGQQPMQIMHMPNGQSMMHMPNGSPMMHLPNGQQMVQLPNGPQLMQLQNGQQLMQLPNGPHMMQMPNTGPMMPNMPRLPGAPPGHMPMTMPMSFPMNGGRLPMVVMPHHSKKADPPRRRRRRPRRKRINIGSSSSEGSCSDSAEYRRSRNKLRSLKSGRRQVLTPVVSYITKDGYVVYQKKIKKDKARDWLEMTKGDDAHDSQEFKEKIRINH